MVTFGRDDSGRPFIDDGLAETRLISDPSAPRTASGAWAPSDPAMARLAWRARDLARSRKIEDPFASVPTHGAVPPARAPAPPERGPSFRVPEPPDDGATRLVAKGTGEARILVDDTPVARRANEVAAPAGADYGATILVSTRRRSSDRSARVDPSQ